MLILVEVVFIGVIINRKNSFIFFLSFILTNILDNDFAEDNVGRINFYFNKCLRFLNNKKYNIIYDYTTFWSNFVHFKNIL